MKTELWLALVCDPDQAVADLHRPFREMAIIVPSDTS
jgi:hypothetical protein